LEIINYTFRNDNFLTFRHGHIALGKSLLLSMYHRRADKWGSYVKA